LKAVNSRTYSAVSGGEVLDLRALQSGDIILSRPAGLESSLIAFFGASEFSHAQLVVVDDVLGAAATALRRTSPDQPCDLVIEATTDVDPATQQLIGGVGYRRLPRRSIRDSSLASVPKGAVSPLTGYVYFDVFRHHAAGTAAFQRFFREHIASVCERYLYKPYAQLHDLAAISIAPWTVEFVANILRVIPDSPRSGLFCSQLVASIFRDGGYPLIDIDPRYVRPGDVARSPELEKITPSTRRQLRPNEELLDLAQGIEAVLPNFLPEIVKEMGVSADEARTLLVPAEEDEANFGGRLTAWALRDKLETAAERRKRLHELLGSLEKITRLALELVERAKQQPRPERRETKRSDETRG
jgi:hypothetical protein